MAKLFLVNDGAHHQRFSLLTSGISPQMLPKSGAAPFYFCPTLFRMVRLKITWDTHVNEVTMLNTVCQKWRILFLTTSLGKKLSLGKINFNLTKWSYQGREPFIMHFMYTGATDTFTVYLFATSFSCRSSWCSSFLWLGLHLGEFLLVQICSLIFIRDLPFITLISFSGGRQLLTLWERYEYWINDFLGEYNVTSNITGKVTWQANVSDHMQRSP